MTSVQTAGNCGNTRRRRVKVDFLPYIIFSVAVPLALRHCATLPQWQWHYPECSPEWHYRDTVPATTGSVAATSGTVQWLRGTSGSAVTASGQWQWHCQYYWQWQCRASAPLALPHTATLPPPVALALQSQSTVAVVPAELAK